MGTVRGRIGGAFGGFDLRAAVDSEQIRGRMGGDFVGGDLDLEYRPATGQLSGRLGGFTVGKDVDLIVAGDQARGRLGGVFDGNDIYLAGSSRLTGRVGGEVIGFDCCFDFDSGTGHLIGRMGGDFAGMDADVFSDAELPPVVVGVLTAITYYYYQVTHRSHGSSGGHD